MSRLGLRWRLAGWVVILTLACMGIAFAAVYGGTGAQVRSQIDGEIHGDANDFAHSLRVARPTSAKQALRTATRYIEGQPFTISSTLLFAEVPGAGTATNRPELFDSGPPDDGESLAEQARENRLAARLRSADDGYSTLALPDVGDLRVLKRTVRIAGLPAGQLITIGVGESLEGVASAQRGVARAFVLAGAIALLGALLGAYAIGTLMSRPLRRIASVAARVDAGDLHPRIHDPAAHGQEMRVLSEAFNHMLDRLTAAFDAQRDFVADASHELRTPLTVIRGQLEVLAAQQAPSSAEVHRVERLVQAEVARIGRLVDDLLLLAKAEQSSFLRSEPVELSSFVEELWRGMSAVAERDFQLGEIPSGTLLADPDRLAQALRNLLANAIEHTERPDGLVRLSVRQEPGGCVRFTIDDNGPGVPPEQRERIFDRFHRTDAARDRASGGAGLGLAIVRAIARAHGGEVTAREASTGGARLELRLPSFVARGTSPPRLTMPR